MKTLFAFLLAGCLAAPAFAQIVSLEDSGVFDKRGVLIELKDLAPPPPGATPRTLVGVVRQFQEGYPFFTLTLQAGRTDYVVRVDLSGLSNADLFPITAELLHKGHKVKVQAWLSKSEETQSGQPKGVLTANRIQKWPPPRVAPPTRTSGTQTHTSKARNPKTRPSKTTRQYRALPPTPLRGEPLRAAVGVLGSADVDFDDEARKLPGVYNARNFSALHIKDLRVTKEVGAGLLHIRYYFPGNPERVDPHQRYLVRLFDANGSPLTYFNTTDLFEIPEDRNMRTWAGYVNFTFQVNTRDLRDTRIVEFGYMPRD